MKLGKRTKVEKQVDKKFTPVKRAKSYTYKKRREISMSERGDTAAGRILGAGGPAFPYKELLRSGMTLRYYFAAQTLSALIAREGGGVTISAPKRRVIAKTAYSLAKELLEAKARPEASSD